MALDFCASLKTLTNWWLQEKIQLQWNSREDWIQLLNSGWAGLDILGRAHKHQSIFRQRSGMLFPVFGALILLRQNVLRNEPLQLYLCTINKKNVLWNQICYNFNPSPTPLAAFFNFLLVEHLKLSGWLEIQNWSENCVTCMWCVSVPHLNHAF